MDYILHMQDGAELYHHGVKGMHWGVWNSETKKRYAGTNSARSSLSKRSDIQEYGGSSLKTRVDANKGVHIKAGSQVSRMGSASLEKNRGAAYYAITKKDADRYKNLNLRKQLIAEKTGKNLNEWGGKYKSNSLLKEDIWAPSKAEAKRALGEALSNRDKQLAMRNAMKNQAQGKYHMDTVLKTKMTDLSIMNAGYTGIASDKLLSRLSNVSGEGRNQQIKEMNKAQGLKTDSIRDEFYKNLKKKGYNAVLDYNDMGKVSEAPLLVFDRATTIYNARGVDIVDEYKSLKINWKREFQNGLHFTHAGWCRTLSSRN